MVVRKKISVLTLHLPPEGPFPAHRAICARAAASIASGLKRTSHPILWIRGVRAAVDLGENLPESRCGSRGDDLAPWHAGRTADANPPFVAQVRRVGRAVTARGSCAVSSWSAILHFVDLGTPRSAALRQLSALRGFVAALAAMAR